MSAIERMQLVDKLNELTPAEFGKLLFALSPPEGLVSGDLAPQAIRVLQLLEWARSPTGVGLGKVKSLLGRLHNLPTPNPEFEALVKSIRSAVHDDIQARCGTIRVLDMEQPIGIGDIYTSVNILEKISGRQRLGLDELMQGCDPENFDRFLLGQIHHKRVPGLEVVERYKKLMVLGKPGAGKTTFMKWLAILCNQGKFQSKQVSVFVTLKEYAETSEKLNLQEYISRNWQICGVANYNAVQMILSQGRAMILLDGLDEVQDVDHDRVIQDIMTLTKQFRGCHCIITSRIAAREYIFEEFVEVEVADFDKKQIVEFSDKWFLAKQEPQKAKTFTQKLDQNKPILELAATPLLLTPLCLVFGEANKFPSSRAMLYREGIDVLLKKWDEKRRVKRDYVYKSLSLNRKIEMLSQFAFMTFDRGDYFFSKSVVENHIFSYIQNLPNAGQKEEILQLDGEAILKSIEAQHGLLVERAKNIYSFSHLTFQEYFIARNLIDRTQSLNFTLKDLSVFIAQKRYREIFLLATEILPESDSFLLMIKHQADQIMVDIPSRKTRFQTVLVWINIKSLTASAYYKPAALRALHYPGSDYSLARSIDSDFDRIYQSLNGDLDLILKIHSLRSDSSGRTKRKKRNFGRWQRFQSWIVSLWTQIVNYGKRKEDFKFTQSEEETVRTYYYVNKLLVDCLNSACSIKNVSEDTRKYIEETLMLPLAEIKKYPMPKISSDHPSGSFVG